MGKCSVEIERIEVAFKPDWTVVVVWARAIGDCPLGVQGSHRKVFPKDRALVEILNHDLPGFSMWPAGLIDD